MAYKRRDSFMPYARLLHEFWTKKCWRSLGYEQVLDWTKRRYPKNRYWPYVLVRIANHLSPHLSDEQLQKIGISKCYELARITKQGTLPDPEMVRNALELPFKHFKVLVEARRRGGAKVEFGEYLNPALHGLQHAPVNELGVVYLFGMVSHELGFIVEVIQSKFPDCLAKERIQGKGEKWRPVRIEFEYKSSNFNHPPQGVDIVVCWEHDWLECPAKRVIELKSAIKKLPTF